MTDNYLQQKLGELIYELGEINFDAIKNEFWEEYINKNTPFNEKQLEAFRYFTLDLIQHELSELSKTYIR